MKKLILAVVFLIGSFAYAQNVSLTVNTSGFKNNDGKVKVGLYNSASKFLKETEAYLLIISDITNLKASVRFENLIPGDYAVSIYHDQDNDGKLKTGIFGIPKEDYACSNNAKGKMAPPKYTDAKFTISEDTTIAVILNN